MLEKLKFLIDYCWWATQKILESLEQLTTEEMEKDLGGSFHSIKETIIHIMWVELLFTRRWQSIPTEDIKSPFIIDNIATIKSKWLDIQRERAMFLEELDENQLNKQIEYLNTKGQNVKIELWKTIFQSINHSTLHRGQIIGKIRQIGKIPPATDFILFCKESREGG